MGMRMTDSTIMIGILLLLLLVFIVCLIFFTRRSRCHLFKKINKKGCLCDHHCRISSSSSSAMVVGDVQHTDFRVLEVPESHGTSTLVLSCIDYRFIDAVVQLVRKEEHVHFYDTFSLAGGSLGYNQSVYSNWPPTFLDTVGLAKSLHGITNIVVVEHMDCGMYKSIYSDAYIPKQERLYHIQNLQTFQQAMSIVEPTLTIRGYLLYENGDTERIV